jgi:trimeric autotransporter adhesin
MNPEPPRGGRRKLSYSNVMSTLAVFLLLAGGTAVAAGLGKNSVNSRTVKNNSLTGVDLRDGSLSGADVADGSLGGAKFPAATLNGSDLADGSLKGADLKDGSLAATKIGNGSVGLSNLANGSVGSPNVVDKSIQGADIGTAVLTGGNILESTLGEVPDAAQVGGQGLGSFVFKGKIVERQSPLEEGSPAGHIAFGCGLGQKLLAGGPANVAPTSTITEDFPTEDIWVVELDTHGVADPFSINILCIKQGP